ncbi:ankyrin repeat domain-containing protein [Streptosporangium sp. NBC_01755]|uniref:ankyrin repeat domain-containing protein n=1 Tax=unclassified Streptosporangium TaxID=2632669 RepID=UPI002DDB7F2D|nr:MULTISPECIES: ankyrin repeat domain-containing protein [unclassified Streptosporangium]WSA26296.1 ankyrin repeat domain-containing protein [Streptosporangium sp. NBC_01810]WSD02276.1 ankyrin repeat domain-containing protein [Streptosporangium sp. NBC_01755]
MVATEEAGWFGVGWKDWTDLALVRARLDAGADPDSVVYYHERPLPVAAQCGSPEVVAELARRVREVDAENNGCTALWDAVFANRPDNARALVAAGADPWRPMMAGWSPGRLSLATPTPDLFTPRPADVGLSAAEAAAEAEARRLLAAVGRFSPHMGLGLACVSGIDAAEAVRRLQATPVEWSRRADDDKESLHTVGVTDVPGGCVVSQPWNYMPHTPGVTKRLSMGTVCYAMYANAASGNQGSVTRDGVIEERDTRDGVSSGDSAETVLALYLYKRQAVARCCARAGLRLTDARAITGPPDIWVRLPERDYWS